MPGALSICSSSEDMAKWMRFHLSDGKTEDGQQLVSALRLQDTYQGHMATPAGGEAKPTFPVTYALNGYGMGWFSGFQRGKQKKLISKIQP